MREESLRQSFGPMMSMMEAHLGRAIFPVVRLYYIWITGRKLVKMCGPQHVDKNGIHNILTDARVLVFGIYVSILLLPCLWAGCLGLDVEKMMPTNEDLHSPLFYGSASLQPPPHQQKEGGNVTPHF